MSNTIKIEINKEELICSICLGDLSGSIYRCVKGPHYACETCNSKLTNCPICRDSNKYVRDISLEQSLKPHIISCSRNCGIKHYNWTNHESECVKIPFQCKYCKRSIEQNCNQILNHYKNFCDIKFEIVPLNLNKNKFKYNADSKPTILIINKKLMILTMLKNDDYLFSAISDSNDFLNKNIQINISYINANLKIKMGKQINENIKLNKSLGNNFLFEIPENKDLTNKNILNKNLTELSEIYKYLFNFN